MEAATARGSVLTLGGGGNASSGTSSTGCSGAEAMAVSSRSRCSTIRAAVAASNRSVLYSSAPVNRSASSSIVSVRSNLAVWVSTMGSGSSRRPATSAPAGGTL